MALNPNKIKVSEEISVREFYDFFKDILQLEILAGSDGLDKMILEPSLNRPALAITGYFKNFASKRLQLFGAGEMAYMRDLPEESQLRVMREIIAHEIPCVIISRNLPPTPAMVQLLTEAKIPLLRTKMKSKELSWAHYYMTSVKSVFQKMYSKNRHICLMMNGK